MHPTKQPIAFVSLVDLHYLLMLLSVCISGLTNKLKEYNLENSSELMEEGLRYWREKHLFRSWFYSVKCTVFVKLKYPFQSQASKVPIETSPCQEWGGWK